MSRDVNLSRRAFVTAIAAIAAAPLTGTANAHHRPNHKGGLQPTTTVPAKSTVTLMEI